MRAIIIIFILMNISYLFAQTPEEAVNFLENDYGVGVRAQAMGNAFIGVADDYTATYWNPAGLTQLKTSELSGDLYHLKFNNEATFVGNTILDSRNFTKFNSLGLAYKFPTTRGSLALSFGYNRFKDYDDFLYFSGFSTQSNGLEFELEDLDGISRYYPFDSDVLQTEQISQNGNLSAWSIGSGIELSPKFALGITFNFYSGSSKYLFDFFQDDVDDNYNIYPANYSSYELHQLIDSKFSGWGVKVGSLFHINQNLRLGLTVDFPTTLEVFETYSANDILIFDDDFISELDLGSSEWEYLIKYPFKFSGGLALDLDELMVAASFEYRDWTQVKFDVPAGYSLDEDYNSLLNENDAFPLAFRSVLSYSLGGEYRVPGTPLKIRGGYRYVPSPLIDADESLDREYYSAGFGFNIDKSSSIDFSLIKGSWKRDTIDSYTPDGTQEAIETTRILAGFTFRL
jgi:long-subunit fatty acid transport protein